MWTKSFRNRGGGEACLHEQVTATHNYGLQRTVCGTCGHVSLGYLHDAFEGQEEADTADSSEGAATTS